MTYVELRACSLASGEYILVHKANSGLRPIGIRICDAPHSRSASAITIELQRIPEVRKSTLGRKILAALSATANLIRQLCESLTEWQDLLFFGAETADRDSLIVDLALADGE